VSTTGAASRRRPPTVAGHPSGFWLLLAVTGVLVVIGLVMVLSASSVQSLREHGNTWVYFLRQVMWLALGLVAMAATLKLDYRIWRRFAPPLLAVTVVLLVLVVIPGVGINVYGSSRWLGAGPFRMQPSELAKLAMLLFVADLLARRADRITDHHRVLKPVIIVTGFIGGLIMLQPDLGTTMVMGGMVFALLFVAGVPLLPLASVGVAGTALALTLALSADYRRERVLAFLNPEADPSNTGFQTLQSIYAVSEGGISGVGIGASRAKYGFLPNAHTDFIYAIIGEEAGLIGAVLVLGLFVAFAFLGVRAAVRAPDRFGMLLAAGITASITAQAMVNIGAVLGLLPITGVPLPLVSSGGSSLIITMAAVGLLLNVARQAREPVRRRRDEPAPAPS
jgi:cell division protein FtsW